MKVGDAGVALAFDMIADFMLELEIRRVEKDGGGVAHQRP